MMAKKTPVFDPNTVFPPKPLPAYKPTPTQLCYDKGSIVVPLIGTDTKKWGGFNPKTKTFTAFKLITDEDMSVQEYLDNMTAAIEAGVVFSETFVLDFFGTEEKVGEFAQLLIDHYGQYWVNDRHFNALYGALECNEDECFSYEAMADVFIEKAERETREKNPPPAKKAAAKKKAK
jgi:hypothetical protein